MKERKTLFVKKQTIENIMESISHCSGRRHSVPILSFLADDGLDTDEMIQVKEYFTPQALNLRRQQKATSFRELINAPVKKDRFRASRRSSCPEVSSKRLGSICKRLDFGECSSAKKRVRPVEIASTSRMWLNDVSVPFSGLKVGSSLTLEKPQNLKRVRFSDDLLNFETPTTTQKKSRTNFVSGGIGGGMMKPFKLAYPTSKSFTEVKSKSNFLFKNPGTPENLLKHTLRSTTTAKKLDVLLRK